MTVRPIKRLCWHHIYFLKSAGMGGGAICEAASHDGGTAIDGQMVWLVVESVAVLPRRIGVSVHPARILSLLTT